MSCFRVAGSSTSVRTFQHLVPGGFTDDTVTRWDPELAGTATALAIPVTAIGRPGVVALSRMQGYGTLDTCLLNHHMAMTG